MKSGVKLQHLLLLMVVLLTAACSPAHMVKKDEKLDITKVKPVPGKAAVVVARTTSFGGGVNFYTYLGRKFIGVTKGKSCFVKTNIDPMEEYLVARTESLEAGKFKFEPDTVYYVQQTPRIGWIVARVSMYPVAPDKLASEIGADGCDWYEIDPKDIAEDLSEKEYKEAVTDYEREVKEGHHDEFLTYKGYKVPPQ